MTLPSREEFTKLVQSANDGDGQSLKQLRVVLEENPDVWRQIGDLGGHAEIALVTLVAGPDALARESIVLKLKELRSQLSGPSPSPLERLAVDRIVTLYLQVQYVDTLSGGSLEANPQRQNQIVRWQDQVSRRYNLAIKSLLDIRRLSPATSKPVEPASGRPELRVFGAEADAAPKTATGT